MEIFNEINDKNKDLSIALGFFDGIHIGHVAVLGSAISYAKKNGLKSAVITFENHPKCFFNKTEPEYILKKNDKLNIFRQMGFDFVYFLKFNDKLATLSAKQYLKMIHENFSPKAISTGFNHTFGNNKEGNAEYLKQNQKNYGYEYFQIEPIKLNDVVISSSEIRKNLKAGNIEQVNAMLGYEYFLEETVVEGEKIGRTLGFRTANLLYPKHILKIANGVYQVETTHNGQRYRGVANFGMRPSLGNTNVPILEVHILDFDKDIYGDKLRVEFIKKIRDEKKFGSLDELKNQISKDIQSL